MTKKLARRCFLGAAILALAGASAVLAQDVPVRQPGERFVDPVELALDKPGIWTLHFRYKPPRIMEVDGFDKNGKPLSGEVTSQLGLFDAGTEVNEEPGVGSSQAPRRSRSVHGRTNRPRAPSASSAAGRAPPRDGPRSEAGAPL